MWKKWHNNLTPDQKKTLSLVYKIVVPIVFICLFLFIWQIICWSNVVPKIVLPTPIETMVAFGEHFDLIMHHTNVTMFEAISGLCLGMVIGFILAVLMDAFKLFNYGFKPLLVISQTIPTIIIAPLLFMWFKVPPKPMIILVCLTTFFPIAIGLSDGYQSTDKDMIDLMRSMGANKLKIFWFLKLPNALPNFFSSLKISTTYAIVAAVTAEWLGTNKGLGYYITWMKSQYDYATVFAIIFWVIVLSLILMLCIDILRKIIIRWDKKEK